MALAYTYTYLSLESNSSVELFLSLGRVRLLGVTVVSMYA